MPLSSQFPYYGPLGSGNYNVSLAIPGPLSKISKYYGFTASSTGVALPNTDFLKEFAMGNLGISDGFIKEMLFKNLNSPIASTNEAVFRQFAKQQKLDITDISKYKKGNKFVVPKDAITIPPDFEMTGFKAFEKTMFQSIFETQKPYMEIAKIAIESVAKAEDVIARVAVLLAANPLKAKSRKPIGNSGAGKSRPKAIGYQGASELKSKLREFESIRTKVDTGNIKADDGNPNNTFTENSENSNNTSLFAQKWKTLSIVYSTVTFDPNIDYSYTYINLPADGPYPDVEPIDLTNEDPYDKYKPKSIIFGIYNSKGEAINPNDILKTIGLRGNNRIEVDTPFKKADWVLRSPKWIYPEGTIEWPSFGKPNYVWKKTIPFLMGPATVISKDHPKGLFGYTQKRYREGEKNILTGFPAIDGDLVIHSFDKIEYDTYNSYYQDIIKLALEKSGLEKIEKNKVELDIKKRLEIKNQVEATFNYGHLKSSVYKKVGSNTFPSFMKKSYLPYQIYRPEAENDIDIEKINGKKSGLIWIDPEADYDMKVVRVDPASTIEYLDPISAGELKTSINTFVKNKLLFTSGGTFSISIKKNNEDEITYNNVNSHFIENWNYENGSIKNQNNFKISIWSEKAPIKFNTNGFYNWSIANPKEYATASQTYTNYSIVKMDNGKWRNSSSNGERVKDGINKLGDNTLVMTKDNIITRWYYINGDDFGGVANSNSVFSMPEFGIERTVNLNYEKGTFEVSDKSMPLYKIKIENDKNYKIIDPSQITNNFLTTADLFTKDPEFYGHGDDDDPQTLGRINRYALTDLDTESYYIVEGILKSENEFETDDNGKRLNSGRGSGGGGWYRLPHALGAASSFIRLIIDIAVKMIPKITKLLTLFQNPFKFISDIMADKLNKNFEFLSDEAIKTFKIANQIKSQTDKVGDLSSIKNRIDTIRVNTKTQVENILRSADGKSDIEQIQAQKMAIDLQNKSESQIAELDKISNKKKNLVNKLRDFYKNSILSNYMFIDEKNLDNIFVLSGGATIPFNLFGADLSFGLAADMNNVPKKPVVKLIFPGSVNKFKNVQYLIDRDTRLKDVEEFDMDKEKDKILSKSKPLDNSIKKVPFKNKQFMSVLTESDTVDIKFEDGSISKISSDSLQLFVFNNKSKYNFIYVTEEISKILSEVDQLLQSGNQGDLDIAKEKLELINSKYPNNSAISDKLKEINDKNAANTKNTQPMLKMLLGFITFPIKVVADILKWLFDFFISLTNPFTLASKMKEFLSFKWILKYVNPTYILDIFGFKFKPEKLASFAGGSADLSQYISLGCIPKLPLYAKEQFKDLKDQPLRLLVMFKMMSKVINAFIDFIWSIFGIEAIIPAPHMSIVPDNTPYSASATDIKSLVDGVKPTGKDIDNIINDNNISDAENDTKGYGFVENFIYEVKLSDGSVKSFLNKEELDKFVSDNRDINFDFTFD